MAAMLLSVGAFGIGDGALRRRFDGRRDGQRLMSDVGASAPRSNRRRALIAVPGMALAAVCLALVWLIANATHSTPADRPGLAAFVQALGDRRFVGGRLSGGFAHARISPPLRAANGGPASSRLWASLADLEARYLTADDPLAEAAWAAASLARGDVDVAIDLLRSAVSRAPQRADLWSDSSAALLAATASRDRDELWIQALEHAERARQLDPRLAAALFNRALALQGLSLFDEARGAWDDYLAVDRGSAWAREARSRRAELGAAQPSATEWARLARDLESALEPSRLLDRPRAARWRARLRVWVEQTLLPAWAEARLADDGAAAARSLSLARFAAERLREAGGDPLPALGVVAVVGAEQRDDRLATELARAHLAFRAAARLTDDGAYDEAARTFRAVQSAFESAASPYAAWGGLYDGVAAYMTRDLGAAHARLAALERSVVAGSYLAGLLAWMEGLLDVNENRVANGRAAYLEAWRLFNQLGEDDAVARMSALLGESYAALGDSRNAWRYQRLALARTPAIDVLRRRHLVFQLGGMLAFRDQAPRAALHFHHAVITAAQAAGRPPSLIDGLIQRARALASTSRVGEAARDLAHASSLLPQVAASALREREAAEVDAAIAEVHADTSPRTAIPAAQRAQAYFDRSTTRFKLSGLALLEGRARLAMGDVDRAANNFQAAIDRFELERDAVLSRNDRVRLFRDGMGAYESLMRLSVAARRDPATALELGELARARTLLEALIGPSARPQPVRTLPSELPSDTAVVFYSVQPDRVWIWTVTGGGIQFTHRDLDRETLESAITRVQLLLNRGSLTPVEERRLASLLALLHDALIAPAREAIGKATSLVLVPDGALHSAPFAAFRDPVTGRYLVETHTISLAPSLTAYRRAAAAATTGRAARVLVVADPTGGERAGAWPRLPFARAEAASIGELYGSGRLLEGTDATRDAFLRALPSADVVHYAGHAFVDLQEPDRSHLVLAANERSPEGTLFASELRPSMLQRQPVVVLAACSTNRGAVAVGEGVLSLARPFLEAGARAVLATLWDVEDRNSAMLFERVHQRMAAGLSPAQALAVVQRDYLAAPDATSRQPGSWAWAVAIGAPTVSPAKRRPL
jgi:CHAT domain-containing protein